YSVHDFEDAIVNGFVDTRQLATRVNHEELVDRMLEWVGAEFSRDELVAAFDRLDDLETRISSFDDSRRDQAQLKNLTSKLIGRFAVAAARATRDAHPGPLGRFSGSVVVPRSVQAEIAVLKGTVSAFVMSVAERQPLYREQRQLMIELCEALLERGPSSLDKAFADDWRSADSDADRKRVVVDQVASLTDRAAVARHREMVE
ncbi:MAG TPA: deoxyguanosinetriphosphate triphosphohydrolase, partial [Candidatus Agrococcus pullicola]|nr:deoxyguanosinetriphosphate triphosphohydrolase [Candidatus Agrococcus pullicola]